MYPGKKRITTMKAQSPLPKRIAFDEDGGAYTLSYVMVVPFVMLFMCLIVETTLMMSAKLGTVYSAFAGARVATVWSSATGWEKAEERIEAAAIKAFVPFASGSSSRTDDDGETDMDGYYESYSDYVQDPVSETYVQKKYKNAASSLTVTTDGPPANWDSDITVTVKYECPFRIPGIGRLLGEQGGDGGYYFPLTSKVTLQNEGPQNDAQEMGIGYGTLD
jgi:Flp pilus assembly protein TadG